MRPWHAAVERDCLSKTRYPSIAEAEQTVRILFNEGHGELHPYPCDFCYGFHLTSRANPYEGRPL